MFVPQAIAAIAAAVLGAQWSLRVGPRRVYLTGLVANIAAMGLLVVSQFAESNQALAYALLLLATASLGVGFGLTVPALNTFTAAFNPDRVDGSILVLNAILGLGTALAPLLVAVFDGIGWWWGLPLITAILLVGLFVMSSRLSLAVETRAVQSSRTAIPSRFWIYAGFALCYGVCETMNGNWASLDMAKLGASTTLAAVALSTFWASVTLGRVLFGDVMPLDKDARR
jgi:MFS family permease